MKINGQKGQLSGNLVLENIGEEANKRRLKDVWVVNFLPDLTVERTFHKPPNPITALVLVLSHVNFTNLRHHFVICIVFETPLKL